MTFTAIYYINTYSLYYYYDSKIRWWLAKETLRWNSLLKISRISFHTKIVPNFCLEQVTFKIWLPQTLKSAVCGIYLILMKIVYSYSVCWYRHANGWMSITHLILTLTFNMCVTFLGTRLLSNWDKGQISISIFISCTDVSYLSNSTDDAFHHPHLLSCGTQYCCLLRQYVE